MFLAECEVIDAFCRNDDGLAEALLAAGTLQEILGGMPTFNTLAPEMATDANPPSAPQVEGTDETASYAAPDELAKISAVSRKLVQPKRTIKQNVLRSKMSISTSG